nr:secreted RxLR effector protein 161-like [Ziziphus jujuba var. spinosa]
MKNVRYSLAVGSLMYAQVCTRPDIGFAVGVLGRFMSNPSPIYYQAVKKIFRHLQGTKDHILTYCRTNSLDVVGYSDADNKSYVDDKKSTTGYIFVMAGGVVSWWSAKQSVIASSTIEAEYVACYEVTRHEKVEKGLIAVIHTSTYSMVADPLTKALLVGIFREHVSCMGSLDS